ncbi:hypothetical protein C1752_13134 [Acaryochloris thomasi RCC1774]|uniref:Uncharacterized protein n=1 Tax=Acaryochloris thomasi RCC1774 TaxID=1764569 RepID=A0A2W1J8B8_9CYAN|nr:hypothetical protein [Acaryochloris thomasi]PZD70408.1 hypothetical protein C1752_13134 [Acaryochloris thomasi RCC1774]
MATKPPPPPKRSKGKGEPPISTVKGDPPTATDTRSNLGKPEPGKIIDMNFKVPAEFKRDFKIAAATHGMTQKDLLMEIFHEWSQKKG